MKILFACHGAVATGDRGLTSDMASMRYRALIPARHLAGIGHEVQVVSTGEAPWTDAQVERIACDAIVVSKSFFASTQSLAERLKRRGAKVFVDVCDDHFGHPEHGAHFEQLLGLADHVIASSDVLAQLLRGHGHDPVTISDPVEGDQGPARFAPRFPAVRILCFGNANSLQVLVERWQEARQLSETVPVKLAIVTAPVPEVRDLVGQINASNPQRLRAVLAPWSLSAMGGFLGASDVVWIPSRNEAREAGKSPNRLLEGVWAGRLVVADPIPSYLAFSPYAKIGAGLVQGVLSALNDPDGVERAIAAGQRFIARRHSPFAIGRLWAAALSGEDPAPLRLNLGCGDKLLPGYVNVDVVQARAGARPDVQCDLHDLAPFEDGCADEILSVHVVEHFWRWEIADVLREWIRVLKPGGTLVLECPNLQSACETFLRDPEPAAMADARGQRSMWVFYGDPAWKDPLMIHRWGYTPQSLARLLTEVGLIDVRQEPAQFKLREPRDMRIVGVKPRA